MSKLSKATKNDFPIIVYAKFCISCDYPDEWDKFLDWAQRNGETFKVVRTIYRPEDHKRASEIYDSEDYPPFVVTDDVIDFLDFVKKITSKKKRSRRSRNDL